MISSKHSSIAAVLTECVRRRAGSSETRWLEEAGAKSVSSPAAFLEDYASAARRLGRTAAHLSPEEMDRLRQAAPGWRKTDCCLDDLGRAVLLLSATTLLERDFQNLVEKVYWQGDTRERQALLNVLSLLPGPERFLRLALDACRNNIQSLFESMACENSYPAVYFPDLHFNQMILKALFLEVALHRVSGLSQRLSSELARMARDFASERAAAGRAVPPDLELILPEKDNA